LKNGLPLKSCLHYWFEEDYQQLATLYESIETCSCLKNIISPSKLANHCHGRDITPFFNKKIHEIDEMLTHLFKAESTKELQVEGTFVIKGSTLPCGKTYIKEQNEFNLSKKIFSNCERVQAWY
jgi:hypothetical protein